MTAKLPKEASRAIEKVWEIPEAIARWARRDLNPGPRDYESPALTAELQAPSMKAKRVTCGRRGKRQHHSTQIRETRRRSALTMAEKF
jgi:hypothetical protein